MELGCGRLLLGYARFLVHGCAASAGLYPTQYAASRQRSALEQPDNQQEDYRTNDRIDDLADDAADAENTDLR